MPACGMVFQEESLLTCQGPNGVSGILWLAMQKIIRALAPKTWT